ncbi:MAG: cell division protein FtsA [Bacteroidota bacterium]
MAIPQAHNGVERELPHKASSHEYVVGLDIGTTKVVAIIALKDPKSQTLDILGIGTAPSDGLNRGVVVNIDKTVQSIKQAVEQAEQQSGVKAHEVVVGIAGDHIQSFQTRSIIAISNPNREISQSDVDRLLEDTRKIAISTDRKILHVIPQDFIIDGQDGITDPVGMSGVRMEANVHVVTGLVTAMQNIYRCVERSGLVVKDIVLEPIASSYSVLDTEEKEVGVAVIDIGGGTTDVAIFEENIIRHTAVFAIAGRQVTDDIRKGLGIVQGQAERIKHEFGHAIQESIMRDDVFMIPGVGGRKPLEVSKSLLCQIIQPRMEEIFEFALAEIRRSGYERRLSAGIVVTGGSALVRGTDELAYRVFGMPVKIGIPSGNDFGGLSHEVENPMYATAVGLVLYGMHQIEGSVVGEAAHEVALPATGAEQHLNGSKFSLLQRVKTFFEEL